MRLAAALIPGVAALAIAPVAEAGAWTRPKGKAQVIVKYEDMRADEGLNPDGEVADLPAGRRDSSVGVFAEYGLTDRLTLQFKGDWQDGRDAFVDYEGRGPVEVGLTWQAWRSDAAVVSLYGGYASSGEGRNAGYAAPGVGTMTGRRGPRRGARSIQAGGRGLTGPSSSFRRRGGFAAACRTRRDWTPPSAAISAMTDWCWARPMAGSPIAAGRAGCRSRPLWCAGSDPGVCRRDGVKRSSDGKSRSHAARCWRCGEDFDPA